MKQYILNVEITPQILKTVIGNDVFKGSLKITSSASICIKRDSNPLKACIIASPKQGETGKMISVMNS